MSSFSTNKDQPTLTLESVKLNFLNWRRDPHGPNRIPESLWNEVIHLLSHHSKSKVLSSLGISNSQLVQHLKSREKIVDNMMDFSFPVEKMAHNENNFIKAIITTPAQTIHYFDVVLTKQNGATLQINKLAHDDMLKLTQLFAG